MSGVISHPNKLINSLLPTTTVRSPISALAPFPGCISKLDKSAFGPSSEITFAIGCAH